MKTTAGMNAHRSQAIAPVCMLVALCAVLVTARPAAAEIIYLNNGTVLKGAIVKEGKTGITLKIDDREREIPHADIKRVMYGNRDMEEIYVLGMDGTITRGFLVDQDENAVILREQPDSPTEQSISRKDIREISHEAMYPVDLEFYFKPSAFVPLDSGGADLGTTGLYAFGIGFNSMIAPNLRCLLETGYLRSTSGSNPGQSLRIVPVTLSFAYSFIKDEYSLVPRLGGGVGIAQFNTGEGDVMKSNLLAANAGCGLVYRPYRQPYSFGLWADYAIYFDGADFFQGAVISISCAYRL